MRTIIFLFILVASRLTAQSFTSYYTGDTMDVITAPLKGTVLMGGATENDNAMRWFLERAAGGDIVVLRTTGDDGYNNYFFTDLGVEVNSVQTIVCNSATAAYDPYLVQQIQNAEALWFAGGDQWDYISFWKGTPVADAINFLINTKQVTVGGTSAGCAIQGDAYFSAENGTITSAQALNDPFSNLLTLGYHDFIINPVMQNIITDTHYDNPDRTGRHMAFLARLFNDYGFSFNGIACEEYTAVCIDENNIGHAYGSYPDYEDYVYFLQVNCKEPNTPEICMDGSHLTWNRDNAALKVVKMGAMDDGAGFFDLNDWKTAGGSDYTWQNWWVDDGTLHIDDGMTAPDCDELEIITADNNTLHFTLEYENNILTIHTSVALDKIELFALNGSRIDVSRQSLNSVLIPALPHSVYLIMITDTDGNRSAEKFIY